MNPAETVEEQRKGMEEHIKYYTNHKRSHSILDALLPAIKYGMIA